MLNQPKQKINPIRLILADKQPVARMGLKAALQATADLEVVAEGLMARQSKPYAIS